MLLPENILKDIEYINCSDGTEEIWSHDGDENDSWRDTVVDSEFIQAAKRVAEYVQALCKPGPRPVPSTDVAEVCPRSEGP